MYLASLLEPSYEWFRKDLISSHQMSMLLISEEDLETLIGFFRIALVKNDIKKPAIISFLDFLSGHKDDICLVNKPS